MTLYNIYPKYADRDFSFIVKAQERVRNYFIFDINRDFLKYPLLNLDYDDIFDHKTTNILNDDYYFTASGIILFSHRVVEILNQLDKNLIFYSCKLKNESSNIYALYKALDVESQYIIRTIEQPTSYYFGKLFIDLINEHDWNINYYMIKPE